MKAIFLTGLRRLEIGETRKPQLKQANDILIKIKSVGVCGSDIHYFKHGQIGRQVIQFPYIVGHECSGEIEAAGNGVTRFKPGDRVVIDPAISCLDCRQCQAGRYHTCKNLRFLGTPASKTSIGLEGCLQEYIVMPEHSVFKLPDEYDFEDGALFEPLTIGYYSLQKSEAKHNQTMVILGTGPIGLSVLLAGKFLNLKSSFTTDLIPERIQTAKMLGSTASFNSNMVNSVDEILKLEPDGVDYVFECAGQQETIDQGITLLKPGGTLVLIGIPSFQRISGDIDLLRRKEIRIQNIRRQNACTESAIQAFQNQPVNFNLLKTHHFTPNQAQEAFQLVKNYQDGVIKAFINWE
ncbi:alcohol dehydrogenase catalytic domain-containing protein [candidate division KSB1 bacterium]|nr:alcohol dehydrogenase catalytic domain-containing protein [candidate division KSB1 bacterium]